MLSGLTLWLALGTAQAAPLDFVVHAEALDLRLGAHDDDRAGLVARLLSQSGWEEDALSLLAEGTALPSVRAVLVEALCEADSVDGEALAALLTPVEPRPTNLAPVLDGLAILQCRGEPAAASALLTAFLDARLDAALPEDPDLFEGALLALLAIEDEAALRDALRTVDEAVFDRVLAQLIADHVTPQEDVLSEEARAAIAATPTALAGTNLQEELAAAFDEHGVALIEAMQTDGGSIHTALTLRMTHAILGHWTGSGIDDLAALGRSLADAFPEPPPLAPPALAPGQLEGLSLIPPVTDITVQPARPQETSPGLLGLGIVGLTLSALLGARVRRLRPLAALTLGGSLLISVEGLLRLTDAVTLAERRPLFSFTDWQIEVLAPGIAPGWVQTPGGWMRFRSFEADRPDFRAVVLGASSAHGSNHLIHEAFAAQLEDRLKDRFPDTGIEVLNLGIGGTTSSGVLHAGTQALDLGADLVLVYYGHNEAAQFSRLSLYRTVDTRQLTGRMWLSRSALYSSLAALLLPEQPLVTVEGSIYADEPPDRAALADLSRLAADNLTHNLTQLTLRATRAGAQVLLMQPATNYRFASIDAFEGVPDDPAAEHLALAEAAWGRGEVSATLSHTAAALATEECTGSRAWLTAAELRAHALAASGEREAARESWQRAIDHSARPGVITTPIRAALQSVIDAQGTASLDVDALFYARSPDGISAPGLFWDDLHPSRAGHDLIADALMPYVEDVVARSR